MHFFSKKLVVFELRKYLLLEAKKNHCFVINKQKKRKKNTYDYERTIQNYHQQSSQLLASAKIKIRLECILR